MIQDWDISPTGLLQKTFILFSLAVNTPYIISIILHQALRITRKSFCVSREHAGHWIHNFEHNRILVIRIWNASMSEANDFREWSSNEYLPHGFAEWLKDTVREFEVKNKKGFSQIGNELGVNPSNLSRWIAGRGPLTQHDIQNLASHLSPVVYTFLGLPRPISDEIQGEDLNEPDLFSPSLLR